MENSAHHLLESDHGELDQLLLATLASIDSADAVQAYEHLDFFWARLAMHIRAEHLRLFPAVRRIAEHSDSADGDIAKLLKDLQHDHDFFMRSLARAIKAMRLVFDFGNEAETFAIVRELLGEIAERLVAHNRIEEERIYPLTDAAILDPDVRETLSLSVQKELDNYPQRFSSKGPRT